MNVRQARATGWRVGFDGKPLPANQRISVPVARAFLNAYHCGQHEHELYSKTGLTGPQRRDRVRLLAVANMMAHGPEEALEMKPKLSQSAQEVYRRLVAETTPAWGAAQKSAAERAADPTAA